MADVASRGNGTRKAAAQKSGSPAGHWADAARCTEGRGAAVCTPSGLGVSLGTGPGADWAAARAAASQSCALGHGVSALLTLPTFEGLGKVEPDSAAASGEQGPGPRLGARPSAWSVVGEVGSGPCFSGSYLEEVQRELSRKERPVLPPQSAKGWQWRAHPNCHPEMLGHRTHLCQAAPHSWPQNLTGVLESRLVFWGVCFLKSLCIFREGKREGERKQKTSMFGCLSHATSWGPSPPSTQACALTGNRTGDLLVHRLVRSPLSHTRQGSESFCLNGMQLLIFIMLQMRTEKFFENKHNSF